MGGFLSNWLYTYLTFPPGGQPPHAETFLPKQSRPSFPCCWRHNWLLAFRLTRPQPLPDLTPYSQLQTRANTAWIWGSSWGTSLHSISSPSWAGTQIKAAGRSWLSRAQSEETKHWASGSSGNSAFSDKYLTAVAWGKNR